MTVDDILSPPASIASLIDHTLLKPEATESDLAHLIDEARKFAFASVCVNPCWVTKASEALSGSRVRVCTVIGFPLGANTSRVKLFEAEQALLQGAQELDMVQNVGALLSGNLQLVQQEIASLADLAHEHGALLKVILESCLLNDEAKITACRLAAEAKADFVKTSTGFATSGATAGDVKLMRLAVGSRLGVKASGGIRTLAALQEMVQAGATRIGTSAGVRILEEFASVHNLAQPNVTLAAGRGGTEAY